jgi:hypothetical protein
MEPVHNVAVWLFKKIVIINQYEGDTVSVRLYNKYEKHRAYPQRIYLVVDFKPMTPPFQADLSETELREWPEDYKRKYWAISACRETPFVQFADSDNIEDIEIYYDWIKEILRHTTDPSGKYSFECKRFHRNK